MKWTTGWDRSLRVAAVLALAVCALAWTGEVASASLIYMVSPGSTVLGTNLAIGPNATPISNVTAMPGGSLVTSESVPLSLTPGNQTHGTAGGTLTTIVDRDDPLNPYVNGAAGNNPNALTFIFQVANTSGNDSISQLSINGFSAFDVYVGSVTSSPEKVPTYITPTSVTLNTGFTSQIAVGGESTQIVVETNATNYVATMDPVIITQTDEAASYGPAVATPEPSSLILAAIGMMFFAGLGWRRRRA